MPRKGYSLYHEDRDEKGAAATAASRGREIFQQKNTCDRIPPSPPEVFTIGRPEFLRTRFRATICNMFAFMGKMFTSIAVGVSSLFGFHASVPTVVSPSSTSTQQTVIVPESSSEISAQVPASAAKVVPAKTTTTQTPVQTTPPQKLTQPQTVTPPPIQETPPAYTATVTSSVDTMAQERQAKINSITTKCNSQINALNQQIIDIKSVYYTQVSAIQQQAIPVEFQNGRINKLTNDTNQKIGEIGLQIQQIQLDCQNKLNQL